ncbi:hypothetical protein ACT3SZ_00195 [Corynebacterium sp. AOP40-9SA-29]|uniref:hypothetical protein n=1 Tax=Corynebacterium sp. AOP40-9SA-29 TaxID=3457677 RepID=UPI0040344D30
MAAVQWYHRQVGGGVSAGSGDRVWFRVHVPHTRTWGDGHVDPVALDASLLERLAAGLRVDADLLATAVAPPPRAASPLERSYVGLASLLRIPGHCLIGVPAESAETAERMPWSAAGCGLLASRLPDLPAAATMRSGLQAGPLPGWMVGTDIYGAPVVLHLPPGTTVLLRGQDAATLARTVAPSGRVLGQDVTLVDSVEAWRSAWHPQRCRVVVQDGELDEILADVVADVVVDLDAGTLTSADTVVEVTALPLRVPR